MTEQRSTVGLCARPCCGERRASSIKKLVRIRIEKCPPHPHTHKVMLVHDGSCSEMAACRCRPRGRRADAIHSARRAARPAWPSRGVRTQFAVPKFFIIKHNPERPKFLLFVSTRYCKIGLHVGWRVKRGEFLTDVHEGTCNVSDFCRKTGDFFFTPPCSPSCASGLPRLALCSGSTLRHSVCIMEQTTKVTVMEKLPTNHSDLIVRTHHPPPAPPAGSPLAALAITTMPCCVRAGAL